MLLQVHDELVFETSDTDIKKIKNLITDVMMNAHPTANKVRYTACCFIWRRKKLGRSTLKYV